MEMTKATLKHALLLGATGLIGQALLEQLLDDRRYRLVTVLVRRPLARRHPKLRVRVLDYERLNEAAALFAADDVFCCLGTTIKKAGGQQAFRRVDYDYVLWAAELTAAHQGRFVWVSAVGAAASSAFFYNRVKGELEGSVASLPLRWAVVRPSLLLGERTESRPGERAAILVGRALAWLMRGPLAHYRPVQAKAVAAAMRALANDQPAPAALRYRSGG